MFPKICQVHRIDILKLVLYFFDHEGNNKENRYSHGIYRLNIDTIDSPKDSKQLPVETSQASCPPKVLGIFHLRWRRATATARFGDF